MRKNFRLTCDFYECVLLVWISSVFVICVCILLSFLDRLQLLVVHIVLYSFRYFSYWLNHFFSGTELDSHSQNWSWIFSIQVVVFYSSSGRPARFAAMPCRVDGLGSCRFELMGVTPFLTFLRELDLLEEAGW